MEAKSPGTHLDVCQPSLANDHPQAQQCLDRHKTRNSTGRNPNSTSSSQGLEVQLTYPPHLDLPSIQHSLCPSADAINGCMTCTIHTSHVVHGHPLHRHHETIYGHPVQMMVDTQMVHEHPQHAYHAHNRTQAQVHGAMHAQV
eukprot:882304-Pelagomonas_calceolata.AAC.1